MGTCGSSNASFERDFEGTMYRVDPNFHRKEKTVEDLYDEVSLIKKRTQLAKFN